MYSIRTGVTSNWIFSNRREDPNKRRFSSLSQTAAIQGAVATARKRLTYTANPLDELRCSHTTGNVVCPAPLYRHASVYLSDTDYNADRGNDNLTALHELPVGRKRNRSE